MGSKTDKFKKVGSGTVTSLVAPGKPLGATNITVGSTTNYPTDTGVVISIRTVDTNGKLVAGTYTEWNGIVTSATSISIDPNPVNGSDQVYPAGTTTQVLITLSSYAHNTMVDGLLVSHNQDGTIKDNAVDTVQIKDHAVTTDKVADGAILTRNILNANVTPDKLSNASATAYVAGAESTSSLTYANLTTITDTVTVTIGANGCALVAIASVVKNSQAGAYSFVGIDVSGANTIAASDARGIQFIPSSPYYGGRFGITELYTGLTPGVTTFKMKYRVSSANAGLFEFRRISVVPL